jgi:small subunit ribosomal protein S2
VGTKKQAQEVVAEQAGRVGMPYVNTRWLGGMLTNFQTIYRRLQRLKALREMERSGMFEYLPKKEVIKLRHEKEKLERNLSGLQDMERLPEALFVIDTKKEHIAVTEARKLGIPVIAIVDTNADPDEVDYPIPGNDDAIRACTLISRIVADALQEGQYLAYQQMQARVEPEFEQEPAEEAPAVAAATDDAEADRPKVQLSEEEAAWMGLNVGEVREAPETAGAAGAADEGAGEAPAAAVVAASEGDTSGSDVAAPDGAPSAPNAAGGAPAVTDVPNVPDVPDAREEAAADGGPADELSGSTQAQA